MEKKPDVIQASAKELKHASTISIAGMLIAISVVLSLFNVVFSNVLQISFAFLPIAMGGMLYGPVVGGIMGIAADVLGYFAKPNGPFFPGFTLNALIAGALYGFFLYRKPVSLKRVVVVMLIVTIVINLGLTSYWLSMMYGQAFIALMTGRILKNIVMFPINVALLMTFLKLVEKLKINKHVK